jgi:hypothetical protein
MMGVLKGGPIRNRIRIKGDEIGAGTWSNDASVGESEAPGRQGGHFVDS